MHKHLITLLLVMVISFESFSQLDCGLKNFTLFTPNADAISASSVTLSWSDATPSDFGETYRVEFKLLNAADWSLGCFTSGAKTCATTNLTAGTEYFFRVKASKSCSFEEETDTQIIYSNEIKVILEPPTPALEDATSITSSSFIVNWAQAKGATEYLLDVSISNTFASFVPGYNNLSVSGTSKDVTGLTPNTQYFYRVRAVNSSGISGNVSSNTLTAPSAPITSSATSITTTGFTANWGTAGGASKYLLDVSTSNTFASYVTDYNKKEINGSASTSHQVTALNAGTTYYYRVYAVNASGHSSPESTHISVATICSAPANLQTANITVTSFVASWALVTGAESYKLDVATNSSFTSLIPDYSNVSVSTSSGHKIENLTAGTEYFYRVRAVNSSGTSTHSESKSVLTLPHAPQQLQTGQYTQSQITIQWQAVVSAIEYELEVSKVATFENFVGDYNPKIIPIEFANHTISGLELGTNYFFRMRARNATGVSANSQIVLASTLDGSGNNPNLSITGTTAPALFDESQTSQKLSVITSGGHGAVTAYLYHRANSSTGEYIKETMTGSNNNYSIDINSAWLDDFGMQYYFEVRDQFNPVHEPEANRIKTLVRKVQNINIPIARFGRDVKNYQIISIPHKLTANPTIEQLFEPVMLGYDDTKWRFMKYKDGTNMDYLEGLKSVPMERGQGYWFLSKSQVELSFDVPATTFDNTIDKPFFLSLKKGWNQIGNPFPYNIRWADVLAENGNISMPYFVYNQDQGSFSVSDVMKVYSGGFVLAEADMVLKFSVTLSKQASGGRQRSEDEDELEPDEWIIPFELTQGDITNTLPAIGMRKSAATGKDRYDVAAPPRFITYIDFTSELQNYAYRIARNIVAPQEEYAWHYSLEQNALSPVTITWNSESVKQIEGSLVLYDLTNQKLVNMSSVQKYTVNSANASFKIYYSRSEQFPAVKLTMGVPYPNPFHSEVKIPFDFSAEPNYTADVVITIYDMHGRKISETQNHINGKGVQEVAWTGSLDSDTPAPPGMYLYRLVAATPNGIKSFQGKLIKK